MDPVDVDVAAEEMVVGEDGHQYWANTTLQEGYPTGQTQEEEVGIA